MSRRRNRCCRVFHVATAVLSGICALVTAAVGQTKSSDLPADCSAYSSIPLPLEANRDPAPKTPPACASYRSYRGLGRPVNYSEARNCAWQERLAQKAGLEQNPKEPTAWVIGGSLILADIYFNGAGVERNIPLAMRFACESEEGMAILAVRDVVKFESPPRLHGPFEFCDYAATTFTMNFCAEYTSEIKEDHRTRYYESLKASMTPEQKVAFDKLLAANTAYIQAHAFEVDQGGTIRVVRTVGSQNILQDLFHSEVVHFEQKKWPVLSEKQITTAEHSLDWEYQEKIRQLQTRAKENTYPGAVTADDVSRAEAAWETYRDAWVAFARLRYPAAASAIRTQITLDRYRLLKTIR